HPGSGDAVLARQRRKHLTDKRVQQRIDPSQLSVIHARLSANGNGCMNTLVVELRSRPRWIDAFTVKINCGTSQL
ncbi:hypothetical protein, partial [Nocardia sp. NPDC004711]